MFSFASQVLEKRYFDAGLFAIFNPKVVINSNGAGDGKNFYGYIIPKYKAIDINDEEDWIIAESIYTYMKSSYD